MVLASFYIRLSSTVSICSRYLDFVIGAIPPHPQCKIVLQATIINILNTIWYNRNQSRFNDKKIDWGIAINNIISAVALSGNNTAKASNSSIRDFTLLKKFNIRIKPPKPPIILEVIWSPLLPIGSNATPMVLLVIILLHVEVFSGILTLCS